MLALFFFLAVVPPSFEEILQEPRLERRSEMALAYADRAVDVARKAHSEGVESALLSSVAEVEKGIELSLKSLKETGKPARRNPKYFKRAELKIRALIRRLDGLEQEVEIEQRPPIASVKKRLHEAHDALLLEIMTKKK